MIIVDKSEADIECAPNAQLSASAETTEGKTSIGCHGRRSSCDYLDEVEAFISISVTDALLFALAAARIHETGGPLDETPPRRTNIYCRGIHCPSFGPPTDFSISSTGSAGTFTANRVFP
jgi:hypothetical protein